MQGAQVSLPARLVSPKTHAVELAQILRSHGEDYLQTRPTSGEQRKVLRDITRCRTPTLGGHLETCGNGCGYERLSLRPCPHPSWILPDQNAYEYILNKHQSLLLTLPLEKAIGLMRPKMCASIKDMVSR